MILTPNVMEFKRLCEKMASPLSLHCSLLIMLTTQQIDAASSPETLCPRLASALQNVTIIQKGETDIISNGLPVPSELLGDDAQSDEQGESKVLISKVRGGLKRVGGQGDILSGSTGVLMAWGNEWVRGTYK